MLKLSISAGTLIFTVLLLIAPVIKTEKYIINGIDSSTCNYDSYYHYKNCEASLKNCNHFFLSFTHVLQQFISVLLNGTYVIKRNPLSLGNRSEVNSSKETINDFKKIQKLLKDKLKITPTYSQKLLIHNFLKNAINHYVNKTLMFNDIWRKSTKGINKYQKNQVDYKWKRRTLCAISDTENYFTERLSNDKAFNNINKREVPGKKTLLDYDGPAPTNDIDSSDSLRPHVRVKRNRLESDLVAPFVYQQNYLKDLANSFPQNNYESIDENSYDDDVSLDAKREIKSQEYFTNNEQSNVAPGENDQLKIFNNYPFKVLPDENEEKSVGSDSAVNLPSDASRTNTFENKNTRSADQTETVSLEDPSNNDVAVINRQSSEDSEVQSIPEDPMLTVELVRKKRNNFTKAHNRKDLQKETSFNFAVDNKERLPNEEERSVFKTKRSEAQLNPSRLVTANLKANLLRMKRKAKGSHPEKKSKLKKKKHVDKKHNTPKNSVVLTKNVHLRDTDRLREPRKKKSNDVITEGKSNVEIASIVDKRNNDNNFRRRSVKSKKSIEQTDSENGSSEKPTGGNKIDTDTSKYWTDARNSIAEGDNEDFVAESDEGTNVLVTRNQKQESFMKEEKPMQLSQDTKLRTKRNENTESNHGFMNKEEELRYYEKIREPGSEMDECIDQDESQLSIGNEAEGNRAVRSIEEVKELAKKLVMKVNELQNYLNIEEAAGNVKHEKNIKTRAIDDLCSNVSTACEAFKESPEIVQKCLPVNHEFGSTAKIVERKVHPVEATEVHKSVKDTNKNSVEKKRSVGSRRIVKSAPKTSKVVRRKNESKSGRKWGKWTDWSSCSVTCGKGRQIRWRYCLHDCSIAETEMEEKACQLPACPPGKFLGIF